MHICQDEIAAAVAGLPFVGYCLLCARTWARKLVSMVRK
jgi:hypothetical protein